MASIIVSVLMVTGIAWLAVRALRRISGSPRARIAQLEEACRRANEAGDVAAADQIEARLRDTPGSGWAGSGREGGRTS